jgi:hypothetical protein
MSIFGNTNIQAISALKGMVRFTTAASPAPMHGWEKPTTQKAPPTDECSSQNSTQHAPIPDIDIPDIHITTEMHEALDRTYDDLRGSEPRLSRAKFAEFLRTVQGESESAVNELAREYYTLGDFKYTWVTDFSWDATGPLPEKDLSKPLTNYFISSSHNTYLVGNQLASLSRSSPEAYRTVCYNSATLTICFEKAMTDLSYSIGSPSRMPMYRDRCMEWRYYHTHNKREVRQNRPQAWVVRRIFPQCCYNCYREGRRLS